MYVSVKQSFRSHLKINYPFFLLALFEKKKLDVYLLLFSFTCAPLRLDSMDADAMR